MKILSNAKFKAEIDASYHLGLHEACRQIISTWEKLPKTSIAKRNLLADLAFQIDPCFNIAQMPSRIRCTEKAAKKRTRITPAEHEAVTEVVNE